MSLALRLSIAMILLVVVTTAGTGMLIYKRANDASRPVVFESLKARAGILADGLNPSISRLSAYLHLSYHQVRQTSLDAIPSVSAFLT